jgi:hypothetical protein
MMDIDGAIAELKNKDNSETFSKSTHSLQAIVDDLLAHGDHGLIALKALIDTIDTELNSGTYGLAALEANVTTINGKLDDGTIGLAALKALIDALDAELGNGTYGLSALKTLIDGAVTRLDDGTFGLAALKALIDAVDAELGDGTYGLAALKSLIDVIQATLDDGTSGLDALKTLLDAIDSKLDNLTGETPVSGSVTGNWYSGTATSGETGADLVTIGANDTKKKLHSLLVSIGSVAAGAKITIRLYTQIKGTERKVYQEEFTQRVDPNGLWVVNGTVGIHEALRVEAMSSKSADDGATLEYDYMLEAM